MTATQHTHALAGKTIAITGRLASMSRAEAVAAIGSARGQYVAEPDARTSCLVVGQGGPPLGEDGRLTQSLRRARELVAGGAALEIIGEEIFLELLGLQEQQQNLHRLYSPAQLARILQIPARQIRAWVKHELIRPRKTIKRLSFFDFGQVANLRALLALTSSGVRPAQLRKSLAQLGNWYADRERCLAQIEVLEHDDSLGVRLEDGSVAEPSGQLRLGFKSEPERPLFALLPSLPTDGIGSDEWFERGVEAEEGGDFAQAIDAYTNALDHAAPEPEIYFNLGNAYYAAEKRVESIGCFTQATELEPEFAEAWNNLGNALAELGRHDEAVRAYRRAIDQDPDYPDPYYNLAESFANRELFDEARELWQTYLKKDPYSEWAKEVRERLKRLQQLEWLQGPTKRDAKRPH